MYIALFALFAYYLLIIWKQNKSNIFSNKLVKQIHPH